MTAITLRLSLLWLALWLPVGTLVAQEAPVAAPAPPPPSVLPQAHEYQRVLVAYLGTLTEADFAHGVTAPLTRVPPTADLEDQYRQHLFSMMLQPMIGTKRGAPSVNAPPKLFTLANIAQPTGVHRPPVWPEALIAFERWSYPGNPYHNNRALRLRAFVTAAVNLMMLDEYIDQNPPVQRSDRLGYHLVYACVPFLGSRELLPGEVQAAYAAGVERLARRLMAYGPKGEEPNLDMAVPVGLWYATQVLATPAFSQAVEDYCRPLLTDPRYWHPAGYLVERGGMDLGFGGMSNFFLVWLALASDWPFAKDAVARVYRLRSHLILPDADGKYTGPSQFNARLGSPANADQWDWVFRDYAAAMLTDEAAWLTKLPSPETLAGAAGERLGIFGHALSETAGIKFKGATAADFEKLASSPWRYSLWANLNFPASVNYAYEFYRPGSLARRQKLEQEQSPWLKNPWQRDETFVRNFSDAFVASKQASYGVLLHTGPVGDQRPEDGLFQFKGPLGFGGGQVAAFWTATTGPVLLGRRSGMGWDDNKDKLEQWRTWPIHAVTGCTPAGTVFSSARLVRPTVLSKLSETGGQVTVSGTVSGPQFEQTTALLGELRYQRVFTIDAGGLQVQTTVSGDARDQAAELVESLPVYLADGPVQRAQALVSVSFQVGEQWLPAGTAWQAQVRAIKINRFGGAVQVSFDQPRRVRLAPTEWKDAWMTRAICQTLQIDLLDNADQAAALDTPRQLSYRLAPVAP